MFAALSCALGCKSEKAATSAAVEQSSPSLQAKVAAPVETPAPATAEPRARAACAAPIQTGSKSELKFGDRTAAMDGSRLTFKDTSASALRLGVLGPLNEDSPANMAAIQKYTAFFKSEKIDAVIVTGDVGETAGGMTRVLSELAAPGRPVFVLIGNRECQPDFAQAIAATRSTYPSVINLSEVRVVEFAQLTLLSLPGYHDANYINCKDGCQYYKADVDDLIEEARRAKTPVALISHGPPHGSGDQSLDFTGNGGNVGDEQINRALHDAKIAFGIFSNIKEAGARAFADAEGTTAVAEGTESASLYLNPGPADSSQWKMNDRTTSVGMASVFEVKNGQARFKMLRLANEVGSKKRSPK